MNRGKATGDDFSPTSLPAKGTCQFQSPSRVPFEFGESSNRVFASGFHGGNARVDCPQFEGENPRAWKMKCETYFRVSGISPDVWVGVAALQFSGSALVWLQSTNAHVELMGWNDFSEAVCAKFGREEFQSLIRQFKRLRQEGTVLSYAEKFNELMHQLYAHHPSWNSVFFITEFLDGLKPEVRAAVILHRPNDLDTAVDLACLQEEVLEAGRRDSRRIDGGFSHRVGQRTVGNVAFTLGELVGELMTELSLWRIEWQHYVLIARLRDSVTLVGKNGVGNISVGQLCSYMLWRSYSTCLRNRMGKPNPLELMS